MEQPPERRAVRRFTMSLPVQVRYTSGSLIQEKFGETRDVSYRGLYFTMDGSPDAGSPIEFVLTLPQQITHAGDVNIRCHARVLRVEPRHDGQQGVAAQIEKYEFLPAVA